MTRRSAEGISAERFFDAMPMGSAVGPAAAFLRKALVSVLQVCYNTR